MENLNNVPSTGTFGNSVQKINSNFDLIVNAINSLEYQTTRSKGILNYGQNPATVFPNAVAGDWCMILSEGNVFPATIKTFNGSTWSGSGTWNPEGVDLTQYAKTTDMNTAIANSLAQATARMGYGVCTVSGTSLEVSIPNFILPTSGGTIHVKMSAAGTGASTLNINSTGAKTLWYNGAAVSEQNTWEANEIISVFYDGTRFMASNSQGGGGKAVKIKYDNSQSGLSAENVQDAVDEMKYELTEFTEEILVSYYTEGYYINVSGNLSSNASWKASDFLDISAVAAGDTFVWGGISKLPAACIAFYAEDGTFMQAFSATSASRTITIKSDAAAIGATKVRASFLINGTPSLSKNGVEIAPNNKVQIIGMEELSNSVNQLNQEVPELMDFMQSADGIVFNHKDYSSWDKSGTYGIRVRFIYTGIAGATVKITAESNYQFGIATYANTSPTGTAIYDSGWHIGTFEYTVPSGIGCLTINTAKGSGRKEQITFEESEQNVSKSVVLGIRTVMNDVEKDSSNLITSGAVCDAVYGNGNLAYYGNRVILAPYFFRGTEYMAVSQPSGTGQGAAVYGNYFIQGGTGGKVRVYDLISKAVVANSVSLSDTASTNHVNNICFSNIFPSGNDSFPYMYISECTGQGRCYVENFTLSGSTLVQTINYSGTDVYERNWAIDTENGFIYLIGNTESSATVQGNMVRVKKFALPLPTAGDVIFTSDDVLDQFDLDGSTGKADVFQGNIVFNGKMYSCFGGYATTHRIWVNNLETHELEAVIELDQMFSGGECESINIWKGTLLIGYPNQKKLYQMKF